MKRNLSFCLLLLLAYTHSFSQDIILPLWSGLPPEAKDTLVKEVVRQDQDATRVSMVTEPEISVFLPTPQYATGTAVIICPGGGYQYLVTDKEGKDIARYFCSQGIAAIVLKYRLPDPGLCITPHKVPLLDAQRAIRMVRAHADEWRINPNQIGIMGFSAGGHLASTASTHFDSGNKSSMDSIEQQSSRPDFSLLVYPVISFDDAITHQGSRKSLLRSLSNSEEMVRYYSNELQVTENTPPALLIHATDDRAVPVQNSIRYYEALQMQGIPTEMHIYPYGGHGFGMATDRGYLAGWPQHCLHFIEFLFQQK